MPLSRNALLAIIGVLALASIVAFAAYWQEREKSPSVEIILDQRGLRIDGR
jgi:hypothetical protein